MTRNFVVSLFAAFAFSLTTLAQGVDPLTGRATISIPLGGIGVQDVSVSASLAHHGGALKVNEGPGNAGMGWQIYVGGSVSREVRGLPDDYSKANDSRTGWLLNNNANANLVQSFTSTSDDDLNICADEAADWTYINNLGYTKDTEPDVFYFSAPGLSGKFIFGADGLPKLVPYQDVTITYTQLPNSTAIESFTIKTNQGMIYTFSSKSSIRKESYGADPNTNTATVNQLYVTPVVFTNSWGLTSIESKATGVIANFSYQYFPQKFASTFFAVSTPTQNSVGIDTLNKIKETMTPQRLTQVTIKNYTMTLIWANDLIDKITVSESESGSAKQFDFVYKAVVSTYDYDIPKISKPFLLEVKQQNPVTCEAFPSYQFDYADVNLTTGQIIVPWRLGISEDYFGYYNGTNNANVPALFVYPDLTGGNRFRLKSNGGTPTIINPTLVGAMAVNATYTRFGAVSKITYPTGGSTSYTYENNSYFDATTNEELIGPGVRVASVTTFGGEMAFGNSAAGSGYHASKVSYKYKQSELPAALTSGLVTYPPIYGYTNGAAYLTTQSSWVKGVQLMYSRVTESTEGQGYREYIFDLPGMYPDANATKTKIVRQAGSSCVNSYFKNGTYDYPYGPLKDQSYKRGMPLKITDFTQSGAITQIKEMTYQTNSNPTVIKGLRFEKLVGGVITFNLYDIPVNDSKLLMQEVSKVYSETNPSEFTSSTTTYTYNSRNWVTQTTSTTADGAQSKQFVKYALDFPITAPIGTDQQAVAINKLNTANRQSEVIETWSTFKPAGGTEAMAGAQLTLYKDYGTYVAPYQSLSFVQGAGTGTATTTTSSSTTFTKDANYLVQGPILELNNSLVVNQTDPLTLTNSGTHYAIGTSSPLATFANCKAEHAIYEGFEFLSTRGLVYSGTGATIQTTASAGKKSLQIASSSATVTTAANVTKKENSYRISGWIYATQNATLTIQAKNGATIQGTATLGYTTPNTWKYLETFMDMTNVSATFSLQLTSNATLQLDDFVAMPKSARVSYGSSTPYIGATEQVGDRGLKTKAEYDGLGRPVRQYDQANNLREIREYGNQRSGRVELSANFSSNALQYIVGQTVTFTATQQANCLTPITYSWKIENGTTTAILNGTSVNYTFTTYGIFNVTLTTSTTIAGYSPVSYSELVCVTWPPTLSASLSVSPSTTIYQCDPVNAPYRTFTATVPQVDPSVATSINFSYEWYVKGPSGVWQYMSTTTTGAPMLDPTTNQPLQPNQYMYPNPANNYELTCLVTMQTAANFPPLASSSCNDQKVSFAPASSIYITYINDSPCR